MPNLPILSCLLFETKGNSLMIKSTNLDLGLEISIPVKVEEHGKVAIPAQIIGSFLNNITDDKNITLETKENVLRVHTPNSEANIKTFTTEDFPTIPLIDNGKTCRISSKDLGNGIKSVIYSAPTSSVKPELSSVYVYSNEENLIFVATDSFRLAEKTIKTKKNTALPGILIPFKNASDILKIIDNTDEEIEINSTKNQISFTFGGLYLVSRVIDECFRITNRSFRRKKNQSDCFEAGSDQHSENFKYFFRQFQPDEYCGRRRREKYRGEDEKC